VPKGQWEAARLGAQTWAGDADLAAKRCNYSTADQSVSLNLAKNSSLAIAIGFPDVVASEPLTKQAALWK